MKKEEEQEPEFYYDEQGMWFPKEDLKVFEKFHIDKALTKIEENKKDAE